MLNPYGLNVLDEHQLQMLMGKEVKPQPINELMLQLNIASQESFGVPSMADRLTNDLPDFWAPPLLGNNIAEHFDAMASKFMEVHDLWPKWKHMLTPLTKRPPAELVVACEAGWNRFALQLDGTWARTRCEHPLEPAFSFDTETFVKGSDFAKPIIATATSGKAHYIWLSHHLLSGEYDDDKAPLPSLGSNKLVVMHNSAYDACRYSERYHIGNPYNVWCFCTMSAVTVLNGFCGDQRWVQKLPANRAKPYFAQVGTGKSLKDSYEFYVGEWPDEGDKSLRSIFVDATTLTEIKGHLEPLLKYALNDSIVTAELFAAIADKYVKHTSLTTLVAHLLLSVSVVPLAKDFYEWRDNCQAAFDATADEMQNVFVDLANGYYQAWLDGKLDESTDPWLSQLSWKIVGYCNENPVPEWYHEVRTTRLTTKKAIAAYLAKVTWDGKPVRKTKTQGWCYLEADGTLKKVPHPKEPGSNVGGLFTFDFLPYVEQGLLSSADGNAKRLIELNFERSWWITAGKRIYGMAIRRSTNPLNGQSILVCAPQVVPHNTVSYRTGESLLLTLPSRVKPKIGYELKSKIEAPPGWCINPYDFDSQELQVLSAYADRGLHSGHAPFSVTVLVGSKHKGTDMHTLTSKRATDETGYKVSRDAGKQSVYAMCYGAQTKTVANTIRLWHPLIPEQDILEVAKPVLKAFRGVKSKGDEYYAGGLASLAFNAMHDLLLAEQPATPLLGNKMPQPMWPKYSGKMDAPFQLNWGVQSAGASLLHCSLVGQWWMAHRTGIKSYLVITIHDEPCWLTAKTHVKAHSYLLMIGHAWAWCLLHYNLGIYDMPVSRAFPEGIAIDKVFRKDPHEKVVTMTSPNGFSPGLEVSFFDLLPYADQAKELFYADKA